MLAHENSRVVHVFPFIARLPAESVTRQKERVLDDRVSGVQAESGNRKSGFTGILMPVKRNFVEEIEETTPAIEAARRALERIWAEGHRRRLVRVFKAKGGWYDIVVAVPRPGAYSDEDSGLCVQPGERPVGHGRNNVTWVCPLLGIRGPWNRLTRRGRDASEQSLRNAVDYAICMEPVGREND